MRDVLLLLILGLLAPGVAPTQTARQRISRVRIPDYVAMGTAIRVVFPREIGVRGDVVLELLVEKNGRVGNVRDVSGNKRLLRITKPVLMKWTFQPYFLNGEPIQFLTRITIQFDGESQLARLKLSKEDPLSLLGRTPKSPH